MTIRLGSTTGSTGFTLGPTQNIFDSGLDDKTAAETLRDDYATANPSWLASYDANDTLNIQLYYYQDGNYVVQYQVRSGGEWYDNGSVSAIRGAAGSGTDFSGITENHIPAIGSAPNYTPYDSGFFVADDGTLTTPGSVQTGPGSLKIGPKFVLSSGVQATALTLGSGEKALGVNVEYDETGSVDPFYYKLSAQSILDINTTSDTVFSSPFEFAYATVGDNLTVDFDIIPNEAGELVVQFYEGVDDTGDIIFDETKTIEASDVGNITRFSVGNPYLFSGGTSLFVRFSGIELLGGVAGPSDILVGQSTIYFRSYVNGYTVTNFLTEDATSDDIDNASTVTGASISDALETLDSGLTSVETDITTIQSDVTTLQSDITTIQSDITVVEGDITTLQTDVSTNASDITTLQSDVSTLQTDVSTLQTDLSTAEGNISTLQSEVSTLQSDVSTLQSDVTTLEDIVNPEDGDPFTATLTTTNSTWTTIYTFPVATDEYGEFDFEVLAKRDGVSGLFRRRREGIYQDVGGSLNETADTTYSNSISATGLSVRERISGSNVNIQVRGRSSQTWGWKINGLLTVLSL